MDPPNPEEGPREIAQLGTTRFRMAKCGTLKARGGGEEKNSHGDIRC